MQIDGGKNDKFAAWADTGGLVMGYYDGSQLPLWGVARKYVLADNFFQAAFGAPSSTTSNWICACAPKYPTLASSAAKPALR